MAINIETLQDWARAVGASSSRSLDDCYMLLMPEPKEAKGHVPRSSFRFGAMTKRQARRARWRSYQAIRIERL